MRERESVCVCIYPMVTHASILYDVRRDTVYYMGNILHCEKLTPIALKNMPILPMKRHTRESILATYNNYITRKKQEYNVEYQKVLRQLDIAASKGSLSCEVVMRYDLSCENGVWESDLVKYVERALAEDNIACLAQCQPCTMRVWIDLRSPPSDTTSSLDATVCSTSEEEDPIVHEHEAKVLAQ